MTDLRRRFKDDMTLHGLAPTTQKVYVHAVKQLAEHYGRSPDQLSEQELRDYFVYLVKKNIIVREDTETKGEKTIKKFNPQVNRQFVLIFEIYDYLPKVDESIYYFFEKVILPGDKLIIATPRTTYTIKENLWEAMPRSEIANQLIDKLISDILIMPNDLEDLNYNRSAEGSLIRGIIDYSMTQKYLDEKKL